MAGKKTKGGSVDFKVTASGLNKVDKDAKKAGSSFNTLDKNARSADRGMKGASNMSSNATKNFSKMSQGITGGLVPAYATLAAQLFALDALFRFLREAADFRVLQQGQELFAASTGRAMRTLSRDIQAATSAQITFKEASQATAIGLSAGLSPSMLKELGQAARTVSVALGRDTTDSFNRLIRGVTKAEPELLDELGIILRLEEATTRYAASLGLNKNQLTTFQKSQAVANEVLRQAESRYGAIADRIGDDSVNQLNKLMVAFDEVLNKAREFIGPIAEFFGKFLTENIESATAAIGVFAASITGGLISQALPNLGTEAVKQATAVAGSGDLRVSKMMSKKRIKRLSSGTGTKADIAAYSKAVSAKESIMIKFENNSRAEHLKTVKILRAQNARMVADQSRGFERMKNNFKADLYEMQAVHGQVMGSMKMAGVAFGRAMNGIMRMAGFIGIAVMIFQMGKQLVDMFRDIDEEQQKAIEKTEEHTESMKSLSEEIGKTANFFREDLFAGAEERIRAVGGAFQSADIAAQIDQTERSFYVLGRDSDAVKENIGGLQMVALQLGHFDERFIEFARLLETNPVAAFNMANELKLFSDDAIRAGQSVDSMTRAQANFTKQFNAFVQKGTKIPFQDIVMSLNEYQKEQYAFKESTQLSTEEQARANAEYQITLLRLEGFVTMFKLATARQMEFVEAQRRGLTAGTALFGAKQDIKNSLKLAGQINTILAQREDIMGKQMAIENMNESMEKDFAKQKLKFAEQQLKLEKERLAMMIAEQNKFISAFGKAAEAFGNEFGTTLGKVFRGESVSMKEFGKSMVKVLTDSLGKALADRIMRISYRGTPLDPDVQMKKYSTQVEEMLEQKGRDTAKKMQAAGNDNANNAYKALDTGGKDASVNLYKAFDEGGADASKSIYDRMIAAANYHSYKIKTAERDIMIAERNRLELTKKDIDNEIATNNVLLGSGGMEGMRKEQYDIRTAIEKAAHGVYGDYTSTANSKYGDRNYSGSIIKMINAQFDSVRDFEGYSGGFGDKRKSLNNDITAAKLDAVLGIQSGDMGRARSGLESYQNLDPRILDGLKDTKIGQFFAVVEKHLSTYEANERALKGGVKTAKEYEKINSDLTKTSLNLDNSIKDLDTRIDKTGLKDLEFSDPSNTSREFNPNTGDFNTTNESTGNEAGDAFSGGAIGGGGAATFMDQTKAMFPALMGTAEGSTPAFGQFGQSVMEFGTVITQFATLTAQGLALAGKQEEAADIMMEVAKIQMALAVAEMAMKIGQYLDFIPARYGGVFNGQSFAGGGIAEGPEAGYKATLHGTEAVIPLGNDRSVPVKMQGSGGNNNVNVTVNVDQNGNADTLLTGDGARELGKVIASVAQDTIAKEQRSGGLLSSI